MTAPTPPDASMTLRQRSELAGSLALEVASACALSADEMDEPEPREFILTVERLLREIASVLAEHRLQSHCQPKTCARDAMDLMRRALR